MDIEEIRAKLKTKELVLDGNKLYTKEEWDAIATKDAEEAHADLLQLTKKIQLEA